MVSSEALVVCKTLIRGVAAICPTGENISENIVEFEKKIPGYINELLPLAENNSPCPSVPMGTHCTKPYECDYQDRCISLLPKSNETSYKILPYIGSSKDLKSYMDEIKSNDLQTSLSINISTILC